MEERVPLTHCHQVPGRRDFRAVTTSLWYSPADLHVAGVEAAAGADPEPGGREGGCGRGSAGPAGEHEGVGVLHGPGQAVRMPLSVQE